MYQTFLIAAVCFAAIGPAEAKPKKVARVADWSILCERQTSKCVASQNINYQGTNIANIVGFPADQEGAVAGLALQLQTTLDLGKGVTVSIDGQPSLKYNLQFCAPTHCQVNMGLSQKMLNAYNKGEEVEVSYFFAGSPTLRRSFTFSPRGISTALKEAKKRSHPAN